MSEAADEGHCRCGAVRFRVAGAPLLTMACHCSGCQRMAASAFSLSSLYPESAFDLLEGEPVLGGMRGRSRQYFCPSCMSWLYTRPEGAEGFINVRSTTLGNAARHRPLIDVHLREGLGWAESGAPKRFEAVPDEADFPQLTAAYAQWDGRVMQ